MPQSSYRLSIDPSQRYATTGAAELERIRDRGSEYLEWLRDRRYGAALAAQRSVLLREGEDTRVLAPVTNRGEAVGAPELVLQFERARITEEDVELAAHQLAYTVIANRRCARGPRHRVRR